MAISINVNRKMYKGKYYKSVEEGLIKAYKELYPDNNVYIGYEKIQVRCYFEVFVDGIAVYTTNGQKTEKIKSTKKVFINRHTNQEAVVFSDIDPKEFDDKYNDYSEKNYTWIKEKLENFETMMALKCPGFKFKRMDISGNYWSVEYDFPGARRNYNYISGHFDVSPISISTAKSVFNKIKKQVILDIDRIK